MELRISRDKLGSGSYGSVYRATLTVGGELLEVAVKQIENDHDHFTANAKKELNNLMTLTGHDNIVQLKGITEDERFINIAMELGNAGDLEKFMPAEFPELLTKMGIMLDCAKGVSHMHGLRPSVIHRDLKPGNVIMFSRGDKLTAKIADFGLSRTFDPDGSRSYMSTDAGTPWYRAPEMFSRQRQYTGAIDVFSLGLLYYVLLQFNRDHTSTEPTPAELQHEHLEYGNRLRIAAQNKLPFPQLFSLSAADKSPVLELKTLIVQMTAYAVADRLTAAEVEEKLTTIIHPGLDKPAVHSQVSVQSDSSKEVGGKPSLPSASSSQPHSAAATAAPSELVTRPTQAQGTATKQSGNKILNFFKFFKKQRNSELATSARPGNKQSHTEISSNQQATAMSLSEQQAAPSYRNNVPDLLRFAASPLVKVKAFKLKGQCQRMCLFDGKIYCPLPIENCIDVHSLEGELLNSIRLPADVVCPISLHPLPPQHLLLAAASGLYLLNNRGQVQQKIHQEACSDVYCDNQKIVTVVCFSRTVPGGADSKGDKRKDKEVESYDLRVRDSSPPYTEGVSVLDQPGAAVSVLCHGHLIYVGEWERRKIVTYNLQGEVLHSYRRDNLIVPFVCCSDGRGNVLVTSHRQLLLLTPDGGWQQIHAAGLEKGALLTDALVVGDKLYVNDNKNKQILVYKKMGNDDSKT